MPRLTCQPIAPEKEAVRLFADDVPRLRAWRDLTGANTAGALRALVRLALDRLEADGVLPPASREVA